MARHRMRSSWKSIFSLCDLDMQWTGTIWTIIKEGHIRIIHAKFGKNPASSLGGDVLEAIGDDAQRIFNSHNSSPWASGSASNSK